jgi:hypothetical protein
MSRSRRLNTMATNPMTQIVADVHENANINPVNLSNWTRPRNIGNNPAFARK